MKSLPIWELKKRQHKSPKAKRYEYVEESCKEALKKIIVKGAFVWDYFGK